jgi:hypothetical protein
MIKNIRLSLWLLASLCLSNVATYAESRDGGCEETNVLDVVFNPSLDPPTPGHVGSIFVVDVATLVPPAPPLPPGVFPRGSHFVFTAQVYRGYTFDVHGPFGYFPSKVLGTWTCDGIFNIDTSVFVPNGGNQDIGAGRWQMDFNTGIFDRNDPRSIQLLFSTYGVRSVDSSLAGTGLVARTERGQITGGTGFNANHGDEQKSRTYVGSDGSLLIRFFFKEPVCIPCLATKAP